jgi:hypothetical protein
VLKGRRSVIELALSKRRSPPDLRTETYSSRNEFRTLDKVQNPSVSGCNPQVISLISVNCMLGISLRIRMDSLCISVKILSHLTKHTRPLLTICVLALISENEFSFI